MLSFSNRLCLTGFTNFFLEKIMLRSLSLLAIVLVAALSTVSETDAQQRRSNNRRSQVQRRGNNSRVYRSNRQMGRGRATHPSEVGASMAANRVQESSGPAGFAKVIPGPGSPTRQRIRTHPAVPVRFTNHDRDHDPTPQQDRVRDRAEAQPAPVRVVMDQAELHRRMASHPVASPVTTTSDLPLSIQHP